MEFPAFPGAVAPGHVQGLENNVGAPGNLGTCWGSLTLVNVVQYCHSNHKFIDGIRITCEMGKLTNVCNIVNILP